MPGTLYIIATPIGNLDDFSPRGKSILEKADIILCEDTRRTLKLLNRLKIKKPLQSFHQHNQKEKIPKVIQWLEQGKKLALVTDAGTPTLSDPGAELVRACHKANVKVVPIPGPSAITASLSASGLSSDRFLFLGFLPAKDQERKKILEKFSGFEETIVIFEAPHRILKTTLDIMGAWGEREVCYCRELTKVFEEIKLTTLSGLAEELKKSQPKGEISLVIKGAEASAGKVEPPAMEIDAMIREMLAEGKTIKQIASQISQATGLSKNLVYKKALEIKKKH